MQPARCLEGRYELERGGRAYAEIFSLFADVANEPMLTLVQQDAAAYEWEFKPGVGQVTNGMIVAEGAAILPFRIEVPLKEVHELRRRVQATGWRETIADQSQGRAIDDDSGGERTSAEIRGIRARRRPASAGQPAVVPTPVLDRPGPDRVWVVAALMLGAITRDTLGDPGAAGHILQHALDLAGSDRAVAARPASPPRTSPRGLQALTRGEARVLQYLPTNLSAREIAGELFLSVNTVKTHLRHLYQKLGARSRTQAVQQARALGLLASFSHRHDQHAREVHLLNPPASSPHVPLSRSTPRRPSTPTARPTIK